MFTKAVDTLMTEGEDVCWILSGKVPTHDSKIERILRGVNWHYKRLCLSYDLSMMQKEGYISRMRGVANSCQTESLYLCWKGKLPKSFPKNRRFVDPGSPLYSDIVQKVPVVRQADLLQVPVKIRDQWSQAFAVEAAEESLGKDGSDSEDGREQKEMEEKEATKRKYARRNSGRALMRQHSCEEGELGAVFHHDNAAALLQELAFEGNAAWCLHGTPSGGNGIFGLLQRKMVSICLVKNEVHADWLRRGLQHKLEIEFQTRGAPLADASLVARAVALEEEAKELKDSPAKLGTKTVDETTPVKNKDDAKEPKTGEKVPKVKAEKEKKEHKDKKDKKEKKRKGSSRSAEPSRKTLKVK